MDITVLTSDNQFTIEHLRNGGERAAPLFDTSESMQQGVIPPSPPPHKIDILSSHTYNACGKYRLSHTSIACMTIVYVRYPLCYLVKY